MAEYDSRALIERALTVQRGDGDSEPETVAVCAVAAAVSELAAAMTALSIMVGDLAAALPLADDDAPEQNERDH